MESKNTNGWHLKVTLFDPSFNRKMTKPLSFLFLSWILCWATLALLTVQIADYLALFSEIPAQNNTLLDLPHPLGHEDECKVASRGRSQHVAGVVVTNQGEV